MSDILRELNSTTGKLKQLLRDRRKDLPQIQRLVLILDKSLNELWNEQSLTDNFRDSKNWAELVNVIGSGRLVSVAAAADNVLRVQQSTFDACWIGDGQKYAKWLGTGFLRIARLSASLRNGKFLTVAKSLLSQSMSFGYLDTLIDTVIFGKFGFIADPANGLESFFSGLTGPVNRRFISSLLNVLRQKLKRNAIHDTASQNEGPLNDSKVSGTAALLRPFFLTILRKEDMDFFWAMILRTSADCPLLLRSITISTKETQQEFLMEKSWQAFADPLSITHSPLSQQTVLSQLLCLSIGIVHRRDHMRVFLLARSSMHTNGISARLKSSSPHIRILGMSVAVIVSSLIDKEDQRMSFDFTGEDSDVLKDLQRLVNGNDSVGTLHELHQTLSKGSAQLQLEFDSPRKANAANSNNEKVPKMAALEEIDSYEDDQDLRIMATTNSKATDDGDDLDTSANARSVVPIYIRDLIEGLHETEDLLRLKAAISEAAVLIRRKAGFGFELKDHCQDLAAALLRVRDPFEIEGFDTYQRQAMTALIVAETESVGPFYCHSFFFGDCSTRQRAIILDSLALAAQDLAGYSQETITGLEQGHLPTRLHRLLSLSTAKTTLPTISQKVQLKSPADAEAPSPSLPHLSDVIAKCLFFPLLAQRQIQRESGAIGLIPFQVRALCTILETARLSQYSSQMLHEFWDFLLSIRTVAIGDDVLAESMLIGFLTLIQTSKDRKLFIEEHQKELLKTFELVNYLLERTMSSGCGQTQIKAIAAAILLNVKEIAASRMGSDIND